jgi:hypothetical protein
MSSLVLGPLLRYAGETEATVWVETDGPCTVSVLGAEAATFCVSGHHYALVAIDGLEPGSITPYEVHLDGERVWPCLDAWPASVIRTQAPGAPIDIVFGSCRTAYPHEAPFTLRKDQDDQGREVCALRALAMRLRDQPREDWPGAILHLGDQIYADEVDPQTREKIAGEEIADFEEYTLAYAVSWSEPAIRWLLSTIPSAMIFDDHDVIDDWNTSQSWLEEIRANDWWDERIVGAFVSYWIYQHLGNLSPAELEKSDLYRRVREADDAHGLLREFAFAADRTVSSAMWSFTRDFGGTRLVMIDSRAARVLDPGHRAMVDPGEWAWIVEQATNTHCDHLLLGTSLPWLLSPGLHHLEAFNEAVSEGAWGRLAKKPGETVRQAVDMEHWAAFNASWRAFTEMVERAGSGAHAPATIIALGGDVHHAYLAEAKFDSDVRSRVYQATASPFRNPLDKRERRIMKSAASKPFARITSALARSARVPRPAIAWELNDKPVFDNVVGTLHLDGRVARTTLFRARPDEDGGSAVLEVVHTIDL